MSTAEDEVVVEIQVDVPSKVITHEVCAICHDSDPHVASTHCHSCGQPLCVDHALGGRRRRSCSACYRANAAARKKCRSRFHALATLALFATVAMFVVFGLWVILPVSGAHGQRRLSGAAAVLFEAVTAAGDTATAGAAAAWTTKGMAAVGASVFVACALIVHFVRRHRSGDDSVVAADAAPSQPSQQNLLSRARSFMRRGAVRLKTRRRSIRFVQVALDFSPATASWDGVEPAYGQRDRSDTPTADDVDDFSSMDDALGGGGFDEFVEPTLKDREWANEMLCFLGDTATAIERAEGSGAPRMQRSLSVVSAAA